MLLPPHLVSRVSVGAVAVTTPEVEVRVVMVPVEEPKLVVVVRVMVPVEEPKLVVEVLKLVECIVSVSVSNF